MIHAIERARERYGLELSSADLVGFSRDIRAGKSVFLGRDGGSERHLVDHAGVPLVVVMSPSGWILTVLPRAHRFRRSG